MENLLPVFIAVTAAAVVLQACIMVAMFVSMRKTSAKLEDIAGEVKTKVLPAVDQVQSTIAQVQGVITDVRPKVDTIVDNLQQSTTVVRAQVERVDAAVSDVVDRARLQVIRADELLSRTVDRIEQTSDMVHKTVISPVRQMSGIMHGLGVGLEALMGRRSNGRRERRPVPQDEMFI
jgi:ABC-type transporter Mla subunit MlaD